MRKLLKHRKAMSPVIAAIILIAVTVAVSIAVAAWMGALTIGFMATEQLKITDCKFEGMITGETVAVASPVLSKPPIEPGSITLTCGVTVTNGDLSGTGTVTVKDDGEKKLEGIAIVIADSTEYTVTITGTIDYSTGIFDLNADPSTASIGSVTADYLMAERSIVVTAINTGTGKLDIADAKVSGLTVDSYSLDIGGTTVDAGQKVVIAITLNTGTPWVAGTAYNMELVTAKGNVFPYTARAPS